MADDLCMALKARCNGYVVDDANRTALSGMAKWLARDWNGPLDPRKGLWIWGAIGTGKTVIADALLAVCDERWKMLMAGGIPNDPQSLEPLRSARVRAQRLCADFAMKGYEALEPLYKMPLLVVDDLGVEAPHTRHFGERVRVLSELLSARADGKGRNETLTVVTTNLAPAALEARYGNRLADRLPCMFNFVPLPGSSRRDHGGVELSEMNYPGEDGNPAEEPRKSW